VGKHHWEVFNDEGRDSRVGELVTSTLRTQTEAAGDFDIEWANNPGAYHWQITKLQEFHEWLIKNGFDPDDKTLTIGHPKIAQVDLLRSFGTEDYQSIWDQISRHLDVYKIRTSKIEATYNYHWSDADYAEQQIRKLT
jgi:site-specific recombinase XerD